MHRVTWNARRACGKTPTSTYLTYVRVTESGTSFSDLQAVVQAWHPMQDEWSMTFAHWIGRSASAGAVDVGGREAVEAAASVLGEARGVNQLPNRHRYRLEAAGQAESAARIKRKDTGGAENRT